jgi:hypothetical protein
MIVRTEYGEAFDITTRMMAALVQFAPSSSHAGAMMRMEIGKFLGQFYGYIHDGTIGTEMLACFNAARDAGATVNSMDGVREQALLEAPYFLLGNAIVNAGILFSFSIEAQIIVKATFDSREQVDRLMDAMTTVVEDIKLAKSNAFDAGDYQNFVALSASLFQHLSATERQLPRVVAYHMAVNLPALALANRIYSDASRSDELVAENKTVHPAFMQRDGIALSE